MSTTSMHHEEAVLVLTTAGSEEQARTIGAALVEERLAACVNILPGLRSIYRWQGKIWDDEEYLLLIKTTAGRFQAAGDLIRRVHSYDLPEVLAVPIAAGDPQVLAWLAACVAPAEDDPGA